MFNDTVRKADLLVAVFEDFLGCPIREFDFFLAICVVALDLAGRKLENFDASREGRLRRTRLRVPVNHGAKL